jgi:iron(III) transport system permease protein
MKSASTRNSTRITVLFALVITLSVPGILVLLQALASTPYAFFEDLRTTVLPGYLFNTFCVAFTALITAFFIGGAPAYFTHAYDFNGRRFVIFAQLLPLTLPAYILCGIFLEASPSPFFETKWALGQCIGLATAPWAFMLIRLALSSIPGRLIEAAKTLGPSGAWIRLRKIHLPLLAAPLFAIGALISLEAINDFEATSRVGVTTLSLGIYQHWSALQNSSLAAALAVLQIVLVVLFALPVAWIFVRRSWPAPSSSPAATIPRRLIGIRSVFLFCLCTLATAPGFWIPFTLCVHWAEKKLGGMRLATLNSDILSSLLTTCSVTLICLGVALAVSYCSEIGEKSSWRERSVWLLALNRAVPSLLFAFAILALHRPGTSQGWFSFIQNTRLGIVIALAARFVPLFILPLMDTLSRLPISTVDSARTLGCSRRAAFSRVVLPQLRPVLNVGVILVFIESSKELTTTLLLQPLGYHSLPLRIFAYTGVNQTQDAALWILVSILISLYPIWILSKSLSEKGIYHA